LKVIESEVGRSGRVATGNTVGAYDNRKFNAILDYISLLKGWQKMELSLQGTLEASENNTFIRAGLSKTRHNLDKVTDVLAIKKREYDPETKKTFVENWRSTI
jgi:hypothetical protein